MSQRIITSLLMFFSFFLAVGIAEAIYFIWAWRSLASIPENGDAKANALGSSSIAGRANCIILFKSNERYVFLYSQGREAEVTEIARRYANDERLSFNGEMAGLVEEKLRQIQEQEKGEE